MLETMTVRSPIGRINVAVEEGTMVALSFGDHPAGLQKYLSDSGARKARHHPVIDRLDAYFDGEVSAIDDLRVAWRGTAFQVSVWKQLRRTPAGRTTSYGDLARAIGRPGAVRAAGTAAGANPIGIVVPCHRMVRSDGSLGGYAGGLDKKQWLLAHEAKYS